MNYDVIWNTGELARHDPADRPRPPDGVLRRRRRVHRLRRERGQLPHRRRADVPALTVGTNGGNGRSGIIRWLNEGAASPIAGAYPAEDTAIVDPPSWFTAVPATYSVDARLPLTDFFLAGMWQNPESTTAPGSPFVVHGTNTAGTARLVNFAMNPLYRADPERSWPMVGAGAYWADK